MKTPQDIIKEAAIQHAGKYSDTGDWTDVSNNELKKWAKADFIAGATFALSTPELWREQWKGFVEWVEENYTRDPFEKTEWIHKIERQTVTTDELFDMYQEHLKTQQ